MIISFLVVAALSHVPHYPDHPTLNYDCKNNCCKLGYKGDVSQVVYLNQKGGGYEVDVYGLDEIHIDAVFRESTPSNKYKIYAGCGTCDTDVAELTHYPVTKYDSPLIEPFTQTPYMSALAKANRTFKNTCTDKFVMRIHTPKRDKNDHYKCAAVVGKKEVFSFEDIALFPIFVLNNHGSYWNDIWWSPLVVYPLGIVLVVFFSYLASGSDTSLQIFFNRGEEKKESQKRFLREYLYQFAIFAFVGSALELCFHFGVADHHTHNKRVGSIVGAVVVLVILSYTLCIGLTLLAWRGLRLWRVRNEKVWYGHPYWAWLEIPTGISYMFLFGIGFYIGPVLIVLAGLVRFGDWREWFPKKKPDETRKFQYNNPVYKGGKDVDERDYFIDTLTQKLIW